MLRGWLASGGELVLCDVIPTHSQRLHALLPPDAFNADLAERVRSAEEALYANPANPQHCWTVDDLQQWLENAGFREIRTESKPQTRRQPITMPPLDRWFPPGRNDRPRETYAARLAEHLDKEEIQTVERAFRAHLAGRTVPWHSAHVILKARGDDQCSNSPTMS